MQERKAREWDQAQRAATTAALSALRSHEDAHGKGTGKLGEALKKERGELEARVKLLSEMADKYEDLGAWMGVLWVEPMQALQTAGDWGRVMV